ncbi:MAG: MBL fold metallo-hydrolase [Candidatus Pacearchaeota archaeon]
MKITKFGHCCLLIEEKGIKILTDPGTYSSGFEHLAVDAILITHEHPDHFHIDSLKTLIANKKDKGLVIITNEGVGKLLQTTGIVHEILKDGQHINFKGVSLEGVGHDHAPIYKTPPCINTGFFIANRLFYPGDSLHKPHKQVELLALPVAGPWMKLSDAIDYALDLKPRIAFPVHEGILKQPGITHKIPPTILEPKGIKFQILEDGKEYEF